MDRVLEVKYKELKHSRLTVTPTRIAVGIAPNDPNPELTIERAKRIAARVICPVALRGVFRPGSGGIALKPQDKRLVKYKKVFGWNEDID